jgi:hypothetical protein
MIDSFTIVRLQADRQNIAGLQFFSLIICQIGLFLLWMTDHQCGYITKLEKQNPLA